MLIMNRILFKYNIRLYKCNLKKGGKGYQKIITQIILLRAERLYYGKFNVLENVCEFPQCVLI